MFLDPMRPLLLTRCSLFAVISLLACGQTPATTSAAATGTDGASASAGGGGAGPWRSALYSRAWTPALTDSEGRFLHDFSYASYHHGEVEAKAPAAVAVLDVVAK